jgi:hypothetical protein
MLVSSFLGLLLLMALAGFSLFGLFGLGWRLGQMLSSLPFLSVRSS